MAIHWDVRRIRRHMKRQGIQNASQLAGATGITKPTAGKVLAGGRLERIDSDTLEALAVGLGMKPGSLLSFSPDPIPSASSGS
jgi:DNA-binding Xre family transcriptional regulator